MREKYVVVFFLIMLTACKKNNINSGISSNAPEQGYLFNGVFEDSSSFVSWNIKTPTIFFTIQNGLSVFNGNNTFTNYLEYNNYVPFEKNTFSISFIVKSKDSSSYGIGFTTSKGTDQYSSSIECGINLTTTADSGRIYIGYDIAPKIIQSTSAISFKVGDSLGLFLYFTGWDIFLIANNYTNPSTATCHLNNSSMIGSGGKFRIAFLGGKQQLENVSIYSKSKTSTRTMVIGNSISAGSGASVQSNRYIDRIFNSNFSAYENASHPAVKITDVMNYLSEILAVKSKYAIVSLGENERNEELDTAIFKADYDTLVMSLIQNGTKPILVGLCPSGLSGLELHSPFYNNIIINMALKYNLDYVDIDTPLRDGGNVMAIKYNYDDVHPNDAGHLVIATTILKKTPYLVH